MAISRLYLSHASAISRPYLGYISATQAPAEVNAEGLGGDGYKMDDADLPVKLQRSRLMPASAHKIFNYESYECELLVLVGIMICDDYGVIMNS